MTVPAGLAAILDRPIATGTTQQAFPFLTVDDRGFPHVALLSRAEMRVTPGARDLAVAVASRGTRGNLLARRRASIIAVEGTEAHYAKLVLRHAVEAEGLLGARLEVAEHKVDSLGIDLHPITFLASTEVAVIEHWDASRRVLDALAAGG